MDLLPFPSLKHNNNKTDLKKNYKVDFMVWELSGDGTSNDGGREVKDFRKFYLAK